MVTYPYESDAKLSVIKKQFTRVAGTAITAGEMGRINSPTGAITIFAGGSTVAKASAQQLTNVNIITSPVVIVQSRGIIDFLYSEKPCTFKNEMWGYASDGRNDIKFLYYYLKHHVAYFKNAGDGRSSFPQISLSVTEDFPFPLINVDEQQAISDTLSTFDEHIENLTKLIEKKKAIRDGALGDLVTGKTRLDGFERGWDKTTSYPRDWEEKRLDYFVNIYQGGTPSTANKSYWDGDIVWLTPSDVTKHTSLHIYDSERKITEEGLLNSSATLLPKGTILLCTRATIGELAIAGRSLATNQGFKNLVCRSNADSTFLAYLLGTKKEELLEKASGTTFLELSLRELSKINVLMPPLREQQAIASILTAMDEEINSLEQEKNKIIQLKEGAMNDLLTGRVRLV